MKLSIDRELDWFRKLAGGFSVFSGYDGYEIAQVELERGIKEELPGCEEKKRNRYATLTDKKWKANDDETDPSKRNRGADFGIPDGRGTSGERTVSDGKA